MEEILSRGEIRLADKVMVSDPCYGMNTWCQGVIENVLSGKYACSAVRSDEGLWGRRITKISVCHTDYTDTALTFEKQAFEVGVDSGQAGIFDFAYYAENHSDGTDREHVNEEWYKKACSLTDSQEKNPYYKTFEEARPFLEVPDNAEEWEVTHAYYENRSLCEPTKRVFDANAMNGVGFVSSSGCGDGSYICSVAKNAEGKVVAIEVDFSEEEEEEEDYEEEDE